MTKPSYGIGSSASKLPGERARLVPVVADTSREQRVLSVMLSLMTVVPDFARRMLAPLGVSVGQRAIIEAYTEIRCNGINGNERPDGMLVVNSGRKTWRALLEAKIGTATLQEEQIRRYIEIAKSNSIDAVITLSNEFTARPDHHPTFTLNKVDSKRVALFHWPWALIRTQAQLLQIEKSVDDREQKYLLDEFSRFVGHKSTGIEAFSQMPIQWKDVVHKIRDSGRLRKGAEDVEAVVSAWQQEVRDVSLKMSAHVGRKVDVKLSRAQQNSSDQWLKDGCDELVKDNRLSCALQIPDTVGTLDITADLERRSIRCSVRLPAPRDKKRTTARTNWLIRQIKDDGGAYKELLIRAVRVGAAHNSQELLTRLVDAPSALEVSNRDIAPTAFEVILSRDVAHGFSGSRKFIEAFEQAVIDFYDAGMQHLKAWQPSPPRPVAREALTVDSEAIDESQPANDLDEAKASFNGLRTPQSASAEAPTLGPYQSVKTLADPE